MRILHILDHSIPLHSGYAFRTLALLREQRALGWETYHLTGLKQKSGAKVEETIDGWHFYRTPESAGLFSGITGFSEIDQMGEFTHRLESVVKRTRPHMLHAHSPVLNALPALRVGRRLGLPVVYEVRAFWEDAAVDHGTTREGSFRYRITRALETYALKRADAVTTICEGLRDDIVARGIPADKVTVIPNAVDIDKFQFGGSGDQELRARLGVGDARILGYIGSFYAYEGIDVLLSAFPKMLHAAPDLRLLLVGGGNEEARLKQLASDLDVTDKVIFTGRVPHDKVSDYYELLDILVYPRRAMRLTDIVTPLKPLEAMSQGRLVVASDVGGHRELIRHNQTGVLFPAGEPSALAETVVELLTRQSEWDTIKKAARHFVETERNWRGSVAKYAPVYAALTEEARIAGAA